VNYRKSNPDIFFKTRNPEFSTKILFQKKSEIEIVKNPEFFSLRGANQIFFQPC
jgi:hypothetical protein